MPTGTFDLSTLNGQNGFVIPGLIAGDLSGYSVTDAGDINGDGISDILIGAYQASPAGKYLAGQSYVIFGKQSIGNSGLFNLSNLDGSNGFAIPGLTSEDQSGFSVSKAGDVNADGIGDIIIGALYAAPGGLAQAGTSYVIFGKMDIGSSGVLDLSTLNGNNGFSIPGVITGGRVGLSNSDLGDVNGDAIDDFIIGAPSANPEGTSYVIFGKIGLGSTGTFDLSSLNGNNGFSVLGIGVGDESGVSVNSAGDINADGIMDIMIGASYATRNSRLYVGESYVIFGKVGLGSSGVIDLSNLNGINGFVIGAGPNNFEFSYVGCSISGIGDVNRDGINDFIIGAKLIPGTYPEQPGNAYLIFGEAAPKNSSIFSLSDLNGNNGFTFVGVNGKDGTGFSVNRAGDINDDGVLDFIIGAPQASPNEKTLAGKSYVVFGGLTLANNPIFDLSTLNGFNGFTLQGSASGGYSGTSVSSAGDINGDGVTDLIIGAPYESYPGKYNSGLSYIVFGARPPRLLSNQLTLNQGETVLLMSNYLNATDVLYSNTVLFFIVNDVHHGRFELVNSPGVIANSFSQIQIQNLEVRFVHDGSDHSPNYTISVANLSPIVSSPQSAAIFFNAAPTFINNTLEIHRGEKVVLRSQNLAATDVDNSANSLIFTANNVQYGQFNLFTQPDTPVFTFSQTQVIAEQIQFTHDGGGIPPAYAISVSDGRVSNIGGPQAAFINFDAGSLDQNSGGSNSAAIGAAIAVTVSAAVLLGAGAFYIKNNAKQKLEQAIEGSGSKGLSSQSEFRKNVFYPIAKKIYAQIKISGCLGYLSKQTAEHFVRAIHALLEELQKQGVDLELNKMSLDHQQKLVNHIIQHIRLHTIPSRNQYTFGSCSRFFKAEISPVQIEDKAHEIAVATHKALLRNTEDQARPLVSDVALEEIDQPYFRLGQ